MVNGSLFDDVEHTRLTPAKRRESSYRYLNESARPEVNAIRTVLDEWFGRYPSRDANDLRSRFRKGDIQHSGAVFELFLNELMGQLGFRVDVHPELPNSTRHPDFRLRTPTGIHAYLEATLAVASKSPLASSSLEAIVLDALDEIDTNGFWLWVETRGNMTTQPRVKSMVQSVQAWVQSIDQTLVPPVLDVRSRDAYPAMMLSHEGWAIDIHAIPKTSKRAVGRAIGIGPTKTGWLDSRLPIYNAVRAKAKRYGKLDGPFVVAVNTILPDVDRTDEMEALFGKETYTFNPSLPDQAPTFARRPDSIWLDKHGPRNTRVDAVIVFRSLQAWTVGSAYVCMYLNPFSGNTVPPKLLRLPHARAVDNVMEWIDGDRLSDILDLPISWPQEPLV